MTKEQIIDTIFYSGEKLISSQKGTFASTNNLEQVETSAWKNDPELTLIRQSSANAVGDKYMIYQCGMFRKFADDISPLRMKIGQEIDWVYGYKVYQSLGRYEVEVQDGGSGTIKLVESTQDKAAYLASGLIAAAVALLAF